MSKHKIFNLATELERASPPMQVRGFAGMLQAITTPDVFHASALHFCNHEVTPFHDMM